MLKEPRPGVDMIASRISKMSLAYSSPSNVLEAWRNVISGRQQIWTKSTSLQNCLDAWPCYQLEIANLED